jgi:DNA polymerase III subunit delta'
MDAFSQIVGQEQAIALLRSALKRDRIAPAYLFAGVSGIGRSLTAQAFAEMLMQDRKSQERVKQRNHPDILWVEPTYTDKGKLFTAKEADAAGLKRRAAPQIRLEQIREIGAFLSHPPMESKRSLVIMQESQTMAEPAANGLLKTLEEPGQATIILIAPDSSSLLPTLVSRCQRIPFCRLAVSQIQQILAQNSQADLPTDLPDEILALAQGSVGDAIAAYEQFQSIPSALLSAAQQLPRNPREALTLAKQISKELEIGSQLWLVDYLQNYYWRSQGLVSIMQCLEDIKKQLQGYVQPRLVWEVALLQIVNCQT